jgi:hypothetical protein
MSVSAARQGFQEQGSRVPRRIGVWLLDDHDVLVARLWLKIANHAERSLGYSCSRLNRLVSFEGILENREDWIGDWKRMVRVGAR